MYNKSEHRNAATLPRATMATDRRNTEILKNNLEHQTTDITNQNRRPTYGAYTYNSMPRGPYLQYKFNDQQHTIRHLTENDNNDHQHKQQIQYQLEQTNNNNKDFKLLSTTTQITTTNPKAQNLVANANHNNYHSSNYNNYDVQQQRQQQQQKPQMITQQNEFNLRNVNINRLNPSNNQGITQTYQAVYREIKSESNTNCQQQKCTNRINDNTNISNVNGPYNQPLAHLLRNGQAINYGQFNNQINIQTKNINSNKHNQRNDKEDYYINETEIKSNHTYPVKPMLQNGTSVGGSSYSNGAGSSDFLRQIQQKNSNMLARMNAASVAHNFTKKMSPLLQQHSQQIHQHQYHQQQQTSSEASSYDDASSKSQYQCGKSLSEFGRPMNNSSNQLNYVMLSDVIRTQTGGLNHYEGWALLCQSVQALQDLFLADMPSTSSILPLVRPSTVQITSRGRVVLGVTTIGQLDKFNDASSYFDISTHLSPEYLNSMGKKLVFAESDVEKMWIYSLGITLRTTMRNSSVRDDDVNRNNPSVPAKLKQKYDNENIMKPEIISIMNPSSNFISVQGFRDTSSSDSGSQSLPHHLHNASITLEQVIACMCENNLHHRASLMYLLDLNPDRSVARRKPQTINSLTPKFEENKFNFNHINPRENILEVKFTNFSVTVIVNQSPLTKYHSLLIPRLQENLPQILTQEAIEASIEFMRMFDDTGFRIGYNSPGAMASINHLHLHPIYLNQELYCERTVISSFCRSQQQAKPFSHIVMELFKKVVSSIQIENKFKNKSKLKSSYHMIAKNNQLTDGFRSETDSGRSSAHGDKELSGGSVPSVGNLDLDSQNQLKVITRHEKPTKDIGYQKYSTIGYAGIRILQNTKKENKQTNHQLRVVRRRNNAAALKKRNSFRRNTIDVNLFDLEKARKENALNNGFAELNTSKSTNFIDKISGCEKEEFNNKIDGIHFNDGLSMPDLNLRKAGTLSNLRVRRRGTKSFEALTRAYSDESFLLNPKGPEFIMKSSLPSREIELIDKKCQNRRIVSVLLLDGQSVHIGCNAITTTSREVFEAVIKYENYIENFFIGLCALIGGDFVFLPQDLKVYKVAPQIWINSARKSGIVDNVFFTLFLRVKFFLPTLRGISSLESRHMLYLQLRKSILEKHILCTDDDLISLGGLALQAEVGDFQETMKYSEYFTISHYLPEGVYQRNKEMAKYLRNSHYRRRGLHPKEAEQEFIKYIQEMKEYGFHLYSAVWATDEDCSIDVYVGISLGGMAIFERSRQTHINSVTNSKISYHRKLYANFEWLEIENLCYSKHILCIAVRKTESLKAKDNNRIKYKLRMDGRKSYFAFSLASDHHQFYMKLRNSFMSIKSLSDELNIPITTSTLADKNSEIGSSETIPNERNTNSEANPIPENINKIDKQLKASGLRVRNLKKSMLNDNRLLKLKQKFLRRSKSSVGVPSSETNHKKDEKESTTATITTTTTTTTTTSNIKGKHQNPKDERRNSLACSKEENQNKENECPKVPLDDVCPKVYSPNRNRVKMGTRVFSSQFLNKSYENIYDRTLNICRFESANSIDNEPLDDNNADFKFIEDIIIDNNNDVHSLRSTSLSSLYCSEKLSNKFSESPQPTEAYVIHSSIKSDRDQHYNFTLPNETISDSLLDKFHNMSGNNTINDRILTKVTVIKEYLNNCQELPEKDNNSSAQALAARDRIKYATFSQKMVKNLAGGKIKDKNRIDGGTCTELIRHNIQNLNRFGPLSRSQESIFINNKFTLKNGHINQANMSNDLDGYTLGISIVQGSDNNVYVKDLVKNGPGEKSGIRIGDQIVAVNGISLLNLSYSESLQVLQKTSLVVELIVSQIFHHKRDTTKAHSLSPTKDKILKDIHEDIRINANISKKLASLSQGRDNINHRITNHDEYLKHIRFETDDVCSKNDNEQKEIAGEGSAIVRMDCKKRPAGGKFKSQTNVHRNLCALSPAKSMPDLPKRNLKLFLKQYQNQYVNDELNLNTKNGDDQRRDGMKNNLWLP